MCGFNAVKMRVFIDVVCQREFQAEIICSFLTFKKNEFCEMNHFCMTFLDMVETNLFVQIRTMQINSRKRFLANESLSHPPKDIRILECEKCLFN